MRNETTFIQLGLSATLKLGVHLPKMGVFLIETGSARTIYLIKTITKTIIKTTTKTI